MLSPCLLHVTLTGEKNCKRTFREEDEEKEEEGKKRLLCFTVFV